MWTDCKRTRRYKALFLWLAALPSAALAETGARETKTPMLILLGTFVVAMIVFMIWWTARGGKSENKKWAKHRDQLIWARLWEPKDATLLDVQRGREKILFRVKYEGVRGKHGIAVVPGSEDARRILTHLADSRLKDDMHITETKLVAVNQKRRDSSVSKALLGGIAAGEKGFLLGGLAGMGQVRKDPAVYTFRVKYDDREDRTEKVRARDRRLPFLMSKLGA